MTQQQHARSNAVTGVVARGAAAERVRVITSADELRDDPVTADELRRRCVVVKASAAGAGDTVRAVAATVPWMSIWYDHPSWRTGAWRCVVDAADARPQYTAYKTQTLEFHTDMSRYVRPPEYTAIRCLVPDVAGGGGNLVLHIDDIIDRLRESGRDDVVDMLARIRVLNAEQRHVNVALDHTGQWRTSIAVDRAPAVPARIFDRHGASKGEHVELTAEEVSLLDEFVAVCASSADLAVGVHLDEHDVLLFSNWRMLHARLACKGSGRVTEICMGNEFGTELTAPEGVTGAAV